MKLSISINLNLCRINCVTNIGRDVVICDDDFVERLIFWGYDGDVRRVVVNGCHTVVIKVAVQTITNVSR